MTTSNLMFSLQKWINSICFVMKINVFFYEFSSNVICVFFVMFFCNRFFLLFCFYNFNRFRFFYLFCIHWTFLFCVRCWTLSQSINKMKINKNLIWNLSRKRQIKSRNQNMTIKRLLCFDWFSFKQHTTLYVCYKFKQRTWQRSNACVFLSIFILTNYEQCRQKITLMSAFFSHFVCVDQFCFCFRWITHTIFKSRLFTMNLYKRNEIFEKILSSMKLFEFVISKVRTTISTNLMILIFFLYYCQSTRKNCW